jgi:type I site-specific restriction-modification system R (restriction) subunit
LICLDKLNLQLTESLQEKLDQEHRLKEQVRSIKENLEFAVDPEDHITLISEIHEEMADKERVRTELLKKLRKRMIENIGLK